MKPVGFWTALSGTCRGTAIFDELTGNSWWRVLFHTIVMAFLTALVIAGCELFRFYPAVERVRDGFSAAFGPTISVTREGILPGRSPETGRRLALPDFGLLCYAGLDGKSAGLTPEEAASLRYILLWNSRQLGFAIRTGADEWTVMVSQTAAVSIGQAVTGVQSSGIATGEMLGKLNALRSDGKAELSNAETVKVRSLASALAVAFGAGQFFWRFLALTAGPWLYTGLFSLMFRLTAARRLRVLTPGGFWKIGLYAGFPATLVAACFPAFGLPYLSFGMVYVIGMAIYWMVIVGRIERSGTEPPSA